MANILNALTGDVIYSAPGNAKQTLEGAVSKGVDLSNAQLNGAQLNNAYLNGAHLNDAHLNDAQLNGAQFKHAQLNRAQLNDAQLIGARFNGAHLTGARLIGAKISDTDVVSRLPISMYIDPYNAIIFESHMQIGCKFYRISDWWGFADDEIASMAENALSWWHMWSPLLKATHERLLSDVPKSTNSA